MKKYIEILEEIKKTGEAIRAAEANEKKLIDSYIKLEDIKSRIAKKRAVESEMIENSENIKNLKITMKILKNNARVALFYDVLPVALEILAKYSGKPYGEKTRQKISDEVKKKQIAVFILAFTLSRFTRWTVSAMIIISVAAQNTPTETRNRCL